MVKGTIITVTMNTIPTNKTPIPVWWMAWIAILLVVFAVPSLLARTLLISGEASRLSVLQGDAYTDDDLLSLKASRDRVAAWFPQNSIYNDLALVDLEMAPKKKDAEQARNTYASSESWQRKALAVSPADPYGWYRLAYLLYMKEGPTQNVALAWGQSLSTAPFEPRLAIPRLQMGISLGSKVGVEARSYIPGLARQAWARNPYELVQAAHDGTFASVVEAAFINDAEALQSFRKMLKE